MASPDNTDASDLGGWLYSLLRFYTHAKGLGRVFVSRVAFYIDKHNSPEPDIAFVASEHVDRIQRGRVLGGPDLAVEIVSPDSVERDFEIKRDLYARAGVPEYWIVDELEQRFHLLRLDKSGEYRETKRRSGVVRSRVVDGFWLRVEWLWERPLPDPEATLAEIRAGGA
jgi:Uma2 family endonuclease